MLDLYSSLFRTDSEPYEILDIPMSPQCMIQADKVLDANDNLIGIATTPGYSYYFRNILSLTFINDEYSEPGTEVYVLWGSPGKPQKKIRATVAPAPYKKDNRRANLKNL